MRQLHSLLLWIGISLAPGCARETSPAQPPATRAVVVEELARLEARVAESAPQPTPEELGPADDSRLRERVEGLLEFTAGSRGDARETGLTDLANLGLAGLPLLAGAVTAPESEANARGAALDTLEQMLANGGPGLDVPICEVLLEIVRDASEPWIRARAAWLLGKAEQDFVLPGIALRLKYETDPETVVWLAWAAAQYGNYSGFDGLIEIERNADTAEMRELARSTAYELATERGFESGGALAQAWRNGDPNGLFEAPQRSDRFRLTIWRWIDRLDEFQLRGVDDTRFLFERLGTESALALSRALEDESTYVRLHAAQSLGRMGRRAGVAASALVRALDDPGIATQAAESLGRIGYVPARPILEARLAVSNPLEMRVAAARGLAALGLPESRALLHEVFKADDGGVELRQVVAEALVYVNDGDTAVPFLIEALDDPFLEPSTSEAALRYWIQVGAAERVDYAQTLAAWDAAEGDRATRAQLALDLTSDAP